MKLYAFQPDGHGEYSFFVMAENEEKARKFVQSHIYKNHTGKDGEYKYEAGGWGTDYYKVTEATEGEVIENG